MSDVACRIPVRDLREERLARQMEVSRYEEHRRLLRKQERRERSERQAGQAVYWMYLLSPLTAGFTAFVGLLMASAKASEANPVNASHFRFQARTFWAGFLGAATGGAWAAMGGIASVAGNASGGELALAGAGLAALSGMGFFGASLYGMTRLAAGGPVGLLEQS